MKAATPIAEHPHKNGANARRTWIQGLLLFLCLALAGGYLSHELLSSHADIEKRERDRLSIQANVVEDILHSYLDGINHALADIIADFPPSSTRVDWGHIDSHFSNLTHAMPGISNMLAIDAAGVCRSSSTASFVAMDFSSREYFRRPRGNPDPATLFVASPFTNGQGTLSLVIGRMIPGPDGRFGGVVIAGLSPDYFGPLLDSVLYAPDMQSTLSHGDGTLFIHKGSVPDGGRRVIARRTIDPPGLRMDKPLIVMVSRDEAALFVDWNRDVAARITGFILIAIAASIGLGVSLRHRRKVDDLAGLQVADRARHQGFLQNLADNIPGMVGYWTADLRCGFANHTYLEWFGKGADEMLGIRMQDLMGDELFGKNEPFVRAALAGKPQHFERTLHKPSGEVGYTIANYIPDFNGADVRGFHVLVSDVTELKQTQFRLEETKANLEDLVEQRTAELQLALKGAQAANRAKSAFLARTSHELYTPINAILGFSQVLGLGTDSTLSSDQMDSIQEILKAGRHLRGLIDEILEYSSVETPYRETSPDSLTCATLILECVEDMKPSAQARGITVDTDLDGTLAVAADGKSLRLILEGLVSNAIQFNREGGTVQIRCAPGTEGHVRITVRDTGSGIPESALEGIFLNFAQLGSETGGSGGIGLGLALCKRLVEKLGGTMIEAEPQGSENQHGSIRRRTWLAWTVLAAVLGLTLGTAALMKASVDRVGKHDFVEASEKMLANIQGRFRAQTLILLGGAGYFSATDDVSQERWHRYAAAISSSPWSSGVVGVGFSLLMPRQALASHIRKVRAAGYPGYRMWPEGDRDHFSPIVFMEPLSGANLRAFGYDMLSEPVRRAAMERARDTGAPALSGKVTLVQETAAKPQAGTVLYCPVYRNGLPNATVDQRRIAIIGWVYCAFRMDDMLRGILGSTGGSDADPVRIRINDGQQVGMDSLLFNSQPDAAVDGANTPRFSLTTTMEIAGRTWTVIFSEPGVHPFSAEYQILWSVTIAGIALGLLLFFLVLSLLTTRQTALRMAARLNGELVALNSDLETRVADRTAELEKARVVAETASRAKSEFLSTMSHELRTPMNAILGFGQLLERNRDLKGDMLDYVHEMLKAGRHLLELINEVLDLSKIDSGRIELLLERIHCSESILEALELIAPLAEKRGIRIVKELSPHLPPVMADRTRLKQVLVNLLSNAVKYNREDGMIEVSATQRKSMLRIVISDAGEGIPQERQAELFVPFSRLGKESGEIEGTGIGLAISRRLVSLMGGSIGVESEEGVGSSFWIDLPLDATAQAADEPGDAAVAAMPDSPQEFRATLLFIEDDPVDLRLVERILALRGDLRLLSAHSPSLGLELAQAHHPDLILLDLDVQNMDSQGVLARLRSSDWGKGIPVLAVTSHTAPMDLDRGEASGFSAHLTKPFDVRVVLETIEICLAGRK